ncbi:UPF0686 protein C11orf1 homolog isoform X2 [Rhincodon typus]|uniref:UPF0686 protein C11orf1 homolog isoform X2 n=1 Tax=Rhincodon typus TaxID=259920 RepID=UPI00202F578C|nr:UPF0686 protein C11orf1 homolog isoform X2 [Rhincodon typus]
MNHRNQTSARLVAGLSLGQLLWPDYRPSHFIMAADDQFFSEEDTCPIYRGPSDRFGSHIEYSPDGDNRYSPQTLIGKWFEERIGINEIRKLKPLTSQYEYVYRTIYGDSYNKEEKRHEFFETEPHIYPTHQPELDPPHTKLFPKTCYMLDYVDPALLMYPPCPPDLNRVENEQLQYCGPPAPSDADETAEKNQLCGTYISLNPSCPTDSDALQNQQPEVPGFCGYHLPTKMPLGLCTARFCEPCKPTPLSSSGPGLAACCSSSNP